VRRLLAALALGLLPALACVAGAPSPPQSPVRTAGAEIRIAIVDVKRAVVETRDGRAAEHELGLLFDRRQQYLDAKREELARDRQDLDNRSGGLTKDAVEHEREELQRRTTELETIFADYQKELNARQEALSAPIVKRMIRVISRTAEREGYDLVLDAQASPYTGNSPDLTARMSKEYDDGA
jgi:outer membrane protein